MLYCGGWVRDRVLGEPVGYKIDVDLLLTCDPLKVASDFAKLVGGSYFEFEKKGLLRRPTIATVIINLPPYKYRFDFAQIKGRDVEKALIEDLLSRDFTANAMAVSIDDVLSIGAKQTILYDPTHGMEDLQEGLLRPVSLKNLEEDPVRMLRGFRLSVEKRLDLTQDFLDFVKKKAELIKRHPWKGSPWNCSRFYGTEKAERLSGYFMKTTCSSRSFQRRKDGRRSQTKGNITNTLLMSTC